MKHKNKMKNTPSIQTMKIQMLLASALFIFSGLSAQTDSISDIDGNVYKTVVIGTQWWMAENLKVSKYNNGDEIPHVTDATEWAGTDEGAYCYFGNRSSFADSYGNLYNWYTAQDEREVCPSGWHIATDEDWITMEKFMGMSDSEADRMTAWRGTDEGDKLKDESFGGINSSGFTALGTGYRDPAGVYKAMGTDNDYWTSTPYINDGNTEGVLHGFLNSKSSVVRNFHVPGYGFCIRCVRDAAVQVENMIEQPGSRVFPNPVDGQLFVRNAGGNELTIRNIAGQTILTETVSSEDHQVDMSALSGGTYLVSLSKEQEINTTRVVVL